MTSAPHSLFADRALLPEGWRRNVLLRWDAYGLLNTVEPDAVPPEGVERAAGPVIAGMPNLHSHAFQRAMAGLTEYLGHPQDSFWSWRSLMYRFAGRLTPDTLEAVARQLYVEMAKAGYTSVCEFHYVHHDANGRPYANPAEHCERLIAAAADAGIGLTLLPVLYQQSGFGAKPPLPEQARFVASTDWMLDLLARLRRDHPQHAGLRYGVAPHSLRAVTPATLEALRSGLHGDDPGAPIHIHIAEQTKEVDDCVAELGKRPVRWLLDNQPLDERWCLVHATHMTPDETADLAASGAVAGICPTTEANLGDGIFDGVAYLAAGGNWGIGSDSHVSVSLVEELRLLEYSQRLRDRRRNALASADAPVVADRLYAQAVAGGALATGRPVAGLAVGQRADLLVLDAEHPNLAQRVADQLLAGLVFCQHGETPIRDVYAGGRRIVAERRHVSEVAAAQGYRQALAELLG
ncbi:formimidoylglutamate deiminase [Pseudogulbenkiania sp. MAI-1]|uniref:formimidoylglutamate deiminase n=1 Tax=Pseudogulbenkiania sp. MAI-1 TaxID=990370 RepID=UPI00045E738D|nr:formimidoylglutamate deiminase [Pseudogulbenkiania sp. MAI-1]